MKMSLARVACTMAIAVGSVFLGSHRAQGQVTVTTVQTSAPAVIGYAEERRGLFGLWTTYRPIVGTVPVQKTVTVRQTQPYVPPAYVSPVYVAPVYGAPVYVAPTYVPAPTPAPVTAYLAPVPPSPIPVNNYYSPLYPRY